MLDGVRPPSVKPPFKPEPKTPVKKLRYQGWRKGFWRGLIIVLVAALLVAGGLFLRSVYHAALEPVTQEEGAHHLIRIQEGMSSQAVAELLESHGLIKNGLLFRAHLRLNGLSNRLQPGVYQLHTGLSASRMAEMISQGETSLQALTIISGKRLADISKQLEDLGYTSEQITAALNRQYDYSILTDKPPFASLEGYLYPDTYFLSVGEDLGNVIDLVLSNMEEKVSAELREAWRRQGLNTFQAITLASIVQKEVADPEEQRQVAQVFLKRLSLGMPLEADPTFVYGAALTGEPAVPELDSPYNTYKIMGLPPGPIGNVGQSALEAVGNPAPTDYLYFVSTPDGVTYFSREKAEHEENIAKYLR